MFNYNFSIIKLIKQNRNPYVIVGNVLTYVRALLQPLVDLRSRFLFFVNDSRHTEQRTFQIMSMEKLLNDSYAVLIPNIRIITMPANSVIPIGNRLTGESSLGTRISPTSFIVPDKHQADQVSGIAYDFIIYADDITIQVAGDGIREVVDYYKFTGLRYDIRSLNDII